MNNRRTIFAFLTDLLLVGILILQIPFIPLFIKASLLVIGAVIAAHALLSLWQGTNLTTDLVDYEPDYN